MFQSAMFGNSMFESLIEEGSLGERLIRSPPSAESVASRTIFVFHVWLRHSRHGYSFACKSL